jgi:hypothetical protein
MGKALPEKWIDEKESHRCLPRNLICETKKIPRRIHEILVYQNNKKQQGCLNILVTLSFCLRDSRELCPAFTFGTHLRDSPEGHPITVSSLNETPESIIPSAGIMPAFLQSSIGSIFNYRGLL